MQMKKRVIMFFKLFCLQLSALFCILKYVVCCTPSSRSLHVCLHAYLERDFVLIEEISKRPPRIQGGRVVTLTDNDPETCWHIRSLKKCYEEESQQCLSYPAFSNVNRIISFINGLLKNLCSNPSKGMTELMNNAFCLERIRKNENTCRHKYQMNLPLTMAKAFRFQVGSNICTPILSYQKCFLDLAEVQRCGDNATQLWNQTVTAFVDSWCNGIVNSESVNCTSSLLFISVGFLLYLTLNNIVIS